MAHTTVKIGEEDKQKLAKLQALITIKSQGKKLSQQELLSTLIDKALQKSDEIAEELFETVPMSDKDFAKITSLTEDWGVETKWEDIDRTLYGTHKGKRRTQ